MEPLGSSQRPVIVKVHNKQRAVRVAEICEEHGFQSIVGLEHEEDLTDLKKAIQQRMTPTNVYDPCPCGRQPEARFRVSCSYTYDNSMVIEVIRNEQNGLCDINVDLSIIDEVVNRLSEEFGSFIQEDDEFMVDVPELFEF